MAQTISWLGEIVFLSLNPTFVRQTAETPQVPVSVIKRIDQ